MQNNDAIPATRMAVRWLRDHKGYNYSNLEISSMTPPLSDEDA